MNMENLENTWVDLKTIAELKQITTRALRISLQKGKYVYRDVKTQGGKRNPTRVSEAKLVIVRALMEERFYENKIETE